MKQKGICMKRIIYIVTACAFLSVSTAKAQQVLTLKECLEEGLQNNYSLRIVHNEEQISKNNATLGNAETWIILKVRPVPPERLQKTMGSMTRPSTSGLTSTGLFSTDSISVQRTNS